MGSKDRRQAASLTEDLLKAGSAYSYFQAVRLLKRLIGPGTDKDIRTRPELSFSFPASDISGITCTKDKNNTRYSITATFLGLYGVSSPLPNFFTEDLFQERSEDRSTCRDFLDIFNQRIYDILFSCWKKYQLFFHVAEDRNRKYVEKLFCLLGLGEVELQKELDSPEELIRFIGILTQWPRSALGLRTILREAVNTKRLDIEPCCLRKVLIPEDQQCCLGRACSSLGMDALIGSEVPDRQGKFRVRVGPLSADEFMEFIPSGRHYRQVARLTRFFLTVPLEYELKVFLRAEDVQATVLGGRTWSRLGSDTWLFSGQMPHEGVATFYP